MDDVTDALLEELNDYAACNMLTAPPGMCGVSAEVLYDMVCELQARRGVERGESPDGYAYFIKRKINK